jgi:5-hydroxyisourate hydrolase-like protein (transthyretin family)
MDESLDITQRGQSSQSPQGLHSPSKRRYKCGIGLLVLFGLGLLVYSIYVGVHEPDAQETVILGQTKFASASPAGFRILVRDRVSGKPIENAGVGLQLFSAKTGTIKLGVFRTDASGSLAETVNIPDISPGEYELKVEVSSSLGRDHITRKVEVHHPMRLMLSSDKPIYQPGEVIHLRSLAVNSRTQKPFASGQITFEVSDPKGNKVFKESRSTSTFGIASTDFVLATELNEGRYVLRASAGPVSAERTVEVKRYSLPRFKIQITTDKSYYLPGQTVTGAIQADYFFGKAVSDGKVSFKVETFQEKSVTMKELKGATDSQGRYTFQFVLPDFFVGMPQKNEQAFLDLTAEICDTAEHVETKTLSLSVARRDLEITAIPEAGTLIPGLENIIYVLTAYPDGRPAVCRVTVNGKSLQSDGQGVCLARVPPTRQNEQLVIQATDGAGSRAQLTLGLERQGEKPPLLLRTDKAVYEAGQSAQITVLSTKKQNTVYLDVIQEGQTVLTKSISLTGNKTEQVLALPASLVGALKVNAYVISANGEDWGCSRLIYVNPASGLRISGKFGKEVYRPGELARLDLQVVDAQGRAAPTALGITAVDESVFAMSENKPGLLQQFLTTEGELQKPGYQIKFFADPGVLLSGNQKYQALAQAYLSSFSQPSGGSGLQELVEHGYLSRSVLEQMRRMKQMKEFEAFRNKPEYADVMRLLEGGHGEYSLRDATGASKAAAVQAFRRAYFENLKHGLFLGFCGLVVLGPILQLFFHKRSDMAGMRLVGPKTAHYAQLGISAYKLLGALTVYPLLLYPLGVLAIGMDLLPASGWLLLGCEAAIVVIAIFHQMARMERTRIWGLNDEMAPVRAFLWAFLAQFFLSRAGFSMLSLQADPDLHIFLLFVASLFAPVIVLAGFGFYLRRTLGLKGVTFKLAQISIPGVLLLIFILFVLAAIVVPRFAGRTEDSKKQAILTQLESLATARDVAEVDGLYAGSGGEGGASPRFRRDFPETLCWVPQLITDDQGKASLGIPLADSVTSWRTAIEAINGVGKMGSTEIPLPVFQDFFVELDLPLSMSLGDQISVPVACYNYLKEPQDIKLTLASSNWFDSSVQSVRVHLVPNEVKSVSFPIQVLRVGVHSLRITAEGTKMSDAVEREVRVLPTGQQIEHVKNGVLKEAFLEKFNIPGEAIGDSEKLVLKFYPSRFSEIVEGLESIFEAPHGCFEQTSSTTYPNVLALDYLKRMGRLTPEIEIRARKFINAGYQRLLTFEVPGGGFDWFGHAPGHAGLTAYGILEFTDMSRIHPVDPALIERTVKWLIGKQKPDGSWEQPSGYDSWSGKSPVTPYIAWALAESGDHSANLDKALNYLRSHSQQFSSTYQKALVANAFLARDRTDSYGRQLAAELNQSAIEDKNQTLHWASTDYSMTYSHGTEMDIETTALVTMALIKAGMHPQSVKQGLTWISMRKSLNGTWGSTSATILAMRALLLGSSASLGQDFTSSVTLSLNGNVVESFQITKENSDMLKQIDLTKRLRRGENRIELRQVPVGELPFQVAGEYWFARDPQLNSLAANAGGVEPLQIDLQYDRATLPVNDQLNCAVTVRNNMGRRIMMAIVDLGIPPGFEVNTAGFVKLQQEGKIAKMELTGNQVILYLRDLSEVTPFVFAYTLRAKYPLRVQTPRSAVYEYYQAGNRAESKTTFLKATGNEVR